MAPKWSAFCPATGQRHGEAWACGSCLAQNLRASTSSRVSEPEIEEPEVEPEVIDLVSESEPEVADTLEPEVIDLISEASDLES